jgi:hypothetical protein
VTTTSQTQRRAREVPVDPRGWAGGGLRRSFPRSLGWLLGARHGRRLGRCLGFSGAGGLGRIVVEVIPAHAVELRKGKRKHAALKSRWRARALKLVGRGDFAASIEAVRRCSLLESSAARLPAILRLVEGAPAAVFWPVFLSEWSACDDTWPHMPRLLGLLRRNAPGFSYLNDDQRRLFDGLPDHITVYRGCSLERMHGLSWTLSKKVAERFARGHRGLSVPRPTIAAARISRDNVFAVFCDRKEDEIILDAEKLRDVSSSPLARKPAGKTH